jgi:hypothetical protein
MDVHVPRPITRALRKRGVDVITAQEDRTARWSDPDLVDRATELDRVRIDFVFVFIHCSCSRFAFET